MAPVDMNMFKYMNVELISKEPDLTILAFAIRNCHDNKCLSDSMFRIHLGEKDKDLIKRVGLKLKHESTLEHISFTFQVNKVSRALLQEQARHRIASYTVKSSRYTLSELVDARDEDLGDYYLKLNNPANLPYLLENTNKTYEDIAPLLDVIDHANFQAMKRLQDILRETKGKNLDMVKFAMPEAYLTNYTITMNARSLRHFFLLRYSKQALWEIRKLARYMYDALPKDCKFLFADIFNEEELYK